MVGKKLCSTQSVGSQGGQRQVGDFTVSGWISELTGLRTRSKDRPEEASQVPGGHLVDLGGCPSIGTEHMEARTRRALLPIASRGHTSWGHTFSQEIGRLFRGCPRCARTFTL